MPTDSLPNPKEQQIRSTQGALERVLMLARVLRGPGGCPWDREQTVESLTPYLQEETYEVVEAVGARDRESFQEEMGDLLFMVSFLALVGEESGWGSLETAADSVVEKLIRRHPHVFAHEKDIGAGGALQQWEERKREEHAEQNVDEVPSSLGRRPAGLPALTTAYRISEKAGAVGFQWKDISGALEKLDEEVDELRQEISDNTDAEAIERELGDVLYSVVNLSRYLKIDPERALRGTTEKFIKRFRYLEEQLHSENKTPEIVELEEMDALWNEAKEKGIG